MFFIESDLLKITISPKGAELQNINHKINGLEYMWQGDAAYWAKRSPVLFPIVGALKNDTYYFKEKVYQLPRHGFAREMEFEVVEQNKSSIAFFIQSNDETLQNFPFPFRFYIQYEVIENKLSVSYKVVNTGNEEMFFSIGGHPAFKLPLVENTSYEDYSIHFNEVEKTGRWPVTKEGLIKNEPILFLDETKELPLSKELFHEDALVFKGLKSNSLTLGSEKTPHKIEFHFPSFPFLGLWAAPSAEFICIEPWCGIADSVDTNQQLISKEGIHRLLPGALFERAWSASFF